MSPATTRRQLHNCKMSPRYDKETITRLQFIIENRAGQGPTLARPLTFCQGLRTASWGNRRDGFLTTCTRIVSVLCTRGMIRADWLIRPVWAISWGISAVLAYHTFIDNSWTTVGSPVIGWWLIDTLWMSPIYGDKSFITCDKLRARRDEVQPNLSFHRSPKCSPVTL